MAQIARKNKFHNDNVQIKIDPTDRLDFLAAVAMDHGIAAKESLAARVAMVMFSHRNGKTGLIVLKYKTIAAEIGCSVAAVRRAVDVLVRQGWFTVEHQYVNGEYSANRYHACWDRLSKSDAQQRAGVCSATEGGMLGNEQTYAQQRADLCSVTSNQNPESLTQCSEPSESNPEELHTRSAERVELSQGSAESCPSGMPADVVDAIDFSASVDQLEKNLPPFEPSDDIKPVDRERLRRGAIFQMKKLARLGWTLDEIRQYLDAYRRDFDDTVKHGSTFEPWGKTLAKLLAYLVDQCGPDRNDDTGEIYGWKLPDRFLPNAANDNQTRPAAHYGTCGGTVSIDEPF